MALPLITNERSWASSLLEKRSEDEPVERSSGSVVFEPCDFFQARRLETAFSRRWEASRPLASRPKTNDNTVRQPGITVAICWRARRTRLSFAS